MRIEKGTDQGNSDAGGTTAAGVGHCALAKVGSPADASKGIWRLHAAARRCGGENCCGGWEGAEIGVGLAMDVSVRQHWLTHISNDLFPFIQDEDISSSRASAESVIFLLYLRLRVTFPFRHHESPQTFILSCQMARRRPSRTYKLPLKETTLSLREHRTSTDMYLGEMEFSQHHILLDPKTIASRRFPEPRMLVLLSHPSSKYPDWLQASDRQDER